MAHTIPTLEDASALKAAFKKAGVKSYAEAMADGSLEESTVSLYIPTGIVPVDELLGGGFPAGRMSEVYGPEQSFKSGLSLMALECLIYMGGVGIYYDNEETFDRNKSSIHGFDTFLYDIIKVQEDFFKDVKKKLHIIADVDKSQSRSLLVWDSMPATLPKMLYESDEGARTIGEMARINAMELPRCTTLIREALCAFVVVNQVRQNMSMANKYDNPYTTPGGFAPKFLYSLRLLLERRSKFQWYADSTSVDGMYINARVEKNKNNQPFKRARFPIVYQDKRGGDPAMAMLDWLHEEKHIVVGGAGRWNCSEIVTDLKVHKTEFHHAYLENLDAFLGFFETKTGFKYGELALLGVKELTKRMYTKTTPIVRKKD